MSCVKPAVLLLSVMVLLQSGQRHHHASGQTSTLYPYGFTADDLPGPTGDDSSSDAIHLDKPVVFYGREYQEIYVSSNGVLSFNAPFTRFSPSSFPFESPPLITSFWHDFNPRISGSIYYRQSNNTELLQTVQNHIRSLLGRTLFSPKNVFIATWDAVAPFSPTSNGVNTMQVALSTDGMMSYAIFLYEDIQWGQGAQIGFNAGDGINSFSLPQALTNATINIDESTNVGRRGISIFQIDSFLTSVNITTEGSNTIGDTFSMVCTATVLGVMDALYIWSDPMNNTVPSAATTTSGHGNASILELNPVQTNNAGTYICRAILGNQTMTDTHNAVFQFPEPQVRIASDPIGDLGTLQSQFSLLCIIELHPALVETDPIAVDVQLLKDGIPLNVSSPTMTGTTYIHTLHIANFKKSDAGHYSCFVHLRPEPFSSYLIGSNVVINTTQVMAAAPAPSNVEATQAGPSAPVEVRWSHPVGETEGTVYTIYYGSAGKNVTVTSSGVVTYIGLTLTGNQVGNRVAIRSEIEGVCSELVNVTILTTTSTTTIPIEATTMTPTEVITMVSGNEIFKSTCTVEIAISVGVCAAMACLCFIFMVTALITCCRIQRKSKTRPKDRDLTATVNDVNEQYIEAEEQLYEDPDMVIGAKPQTYDVPKSFSGNQYVNNSQCT